MEDSPVYNESYSSMSVGKDEQDAVAGDGVFSAVVIVLSLCAFRSLAWWISTWCTPAIARQNRSSWKWRNISVSFTHSVLTGLWALACVYRDPKIVEDVVSTYDKFSLGLIAVSMGYFIHDTIELFQKNISRQNAELFVHHSIILLCFGIAVVRRLYIGYAVVAMIVEVNSIFLHARQLLQIIKVPKESTDFRLVSLLNLGTFIIFRITPIAWMTRWISQNRDHPLISSAMYSIGCTCLAIMMIINIVLFYRLINSDFLHPKRDHKQAESNCGKKTVHIRKDD